ncbi:putative peptidoglycan glycosyltransferase FtsW [bacterium HR35]|nr:putative peptidoglycan glycosyltransferase FtsW [bacterium HR35]
MKKNIFSFDRFLLINVFILALLGLINFYSASTYYSLIKTGNSLTYFKDFFVKDFILGFFFFFIGNLLGQKWNKFKPLFLFFFFLAYLFLILVLILPFSLQVGEARRWFNLGGFAFQPAETIKPLSILVLSFLLGANLRSSLKVKIILFLSFSFLVILPIFLEPSLSNSLILAIALFFSSLVFLNSPKEIFSFSLFTFTFLIILVLIGILFWGYRQERILSFLTKGALHQERFFQLKQTTIAIASGGFWGKGLGKSQMKILTLPQMLTDSIFAIYAEELGFLGSLALIILFIILFLRILFLAFNNPDLEKRAFCLGVFGWLVTQTFLHLMSNIGVFVPTGVVLPFFSLGASSQIAIYFSLGLISSLRN